MLAEAVQLDGGLIALLIIIFLVMLAVVVGLFVLGCVWAHRAGRGSSRALVGWLVVASIEAGFLLVSVAALVAGETNVRSPVPLIAALGIQVGLYLRARTSRAPEPPPATAAQPPPPGGAGEWNRPPG